MSQPSRSSPSNPHEFSGMLAAAKAGDAEAIGWLLAQNRDYLLFIANQDIDRGMLRKMGASDLVQESMIQAHHYFDRFEGESHEQLLAWLRGILRNNTKHWQRHFQGTEKRSRETEIEITADSQHRLVPQDLEMTPHTRAVADEEEELLNRALEQLPENYRMVIRLRNWDGHSFKQVGQEMACSAEAARKVWSRAIMRLQEVLDGTQAGDE